MEQKHISDFPSLERLKGILASEANAIQQIPITDAYHEAARLIIYHVHHLGGKVITSGMGKAGQIAGTIATTFCSTGTPAVFLHPSEAQHGDLGIICPNDLLLIISNSGKTREILELIDLAKKFVLEIPFICITGNLDSELAKSANITLHTGGAPEVCPLQLTPTTSTTAMTVMGDLLVISCMEAIGFTREEYSQRHHGGYLGSKSRSESTND